jgi:hypothetical protein
MAKISLTVNQETEDALKRVSAKRETPIAVLIRKAIEEYLAANGEKVNTSITWGGYRPRDGEPEGEARE